MITRSGRSARARPECLLSRGRPANRVARVAEQRREQLSIVGAVVENQDRAHRRRAVGRASSPQLRREKALDLRHERLGSDRLRYVPVEARRQDSLPVADHREGRDGHDRCTRRSRPRS